MSGRIAVPDTPAIDGLAFRHTLGPQDADALRAVHKTRAAHDRVDVFARMEDFPSLESLQVDLGKAQSRRLLGEAQSAGAQDRWLIAQVAQEVVGYSSWDSWPERDGTWVYLSQGYLKPEWRGQGISTAMLHWTETRMQQVAAAEHPGEKAEFAGNASSTEKEATALLLHEGYYVAYAVLYLGLDLSVPLPDMPLPPGFELRPALPEHYQPIAASVADAYHREYDGGRFDEDVDPLAFAERLKDPKHDPSLWLVAWEGEQIVGQVLSLATQDRGEVFEVSVRPPWRRRGLARALLLQAVRVLRGRGIDVIRMYTVAEFRTRARDLYESVGFRPIKTFPRYRKSFGPD